MSVVLDPKKSLGLFKPDTDSSMFGISIKLDMERKRSVLNLVNFCCFCTSYFELPNKIKISIMVFLLKYETPSSSSRRRQQARQDLDRKSEPINGTFKRMKEHY